MKQTNRLVVIALGLGILRLEIKKGHKSLSVILDVGEAEVPHLF